jgi:pyruvate/2-oxoglutarate dehydrogenase complex dihydrolipoamide acyltransferase (E2) component
LANQEKSLEAEIQYMLDVTLKGLLAQVDETENDLRDKKIQMIKAKASATSSSPSTAAADVPLNIVGTGPNGEITESDRIKAKAKAMVAARWEKLPANLQLQHHLPPSTPKQKSTKSMKNEKNSNYIPTLLLTA